MQGFNMGRYYPPDASNPPSFNTSSHPLGKRANKISQGILTVRFELPFAVWCDHCTPPAIIGQGVRFNAEKKKVGNYHSTPIWSFRMKHSACGGWWEIRTDPQKSEYTVIEGARRRDYGKVEGEEEGEMKFLTEEERERRREDVFARLEGRVEEKRGDAGNKKRVEELYEKSEVWRDPYDVNARLRGVFREKRKGWKREERKKEGMQEKFSLGIEIVEESEGDRVRAGLVEFGAEPAASSSSDQNPERTAWKPLFKEPASTTTATKTKQPVPKTKKLKAEAAAEKSRRELRESLVNNTMAVIDPFLGNGTVGGGKGRSERVELGIRKRKREEEENKNIKAKADLQGPPTAVEMASETAKKKPALMQALVGYESD
ncbi:DUF455 domain [Pyrenophora seminiperda CCB06]|uniref:DUF455 domain n=1 Tax=Pyrenophora seminiperda CCB06 TaxID=1302712 RepID=A0A3M7M2P2_9PLEO|nr:DUF455 domain [Pyrenophora seminiperda CCB06]